MGSAASGAGSSRWRGSSATSGEAQTYFLPLTLALGGRRRGPAARARAAHRRQGAPAGAGRGARRRLRRRGVLPRAGRGHRRRQRAARSARGTLRFTADRSAFAGHCRRRPTTALPVAAPRRAEQQHDRRAAASACSSRATAGCRPGVNPELEIGRFLTDVAHFREQRAGRGQRRVRRRRRHARPTLALLQAYVANQGDGWEYTLNYLDRVFEQSPAQSDPPGTGVDLHGGYLALMRTLGRARPSCTRRSRRGRATPRSIPSRSRPRMSRRGRSASRRGGRRARSAGDGSARRCRTRRGRRRDSLLARRKDCSRAHRARMRATARRPPRRAPRRLSSGAGAGRAERFRDRRLRRRAGAHARRARAEAIAAEGRRGHAALVRLRDARGARQHAARAAGSACAARDASAGNGRRKRAARSSTATRKSRGQAVSRCRAASGSDLLELFAAREGVLRAALRARQPAGLGAHSAARPRRTFWVRRR